LWEGRYKSTVVDSDDYALICYRYIELNPVRARMVEEPVDYPWSSYRFNAMGEDNDLVTPHSLYTALAETSALRVQIYQSLFEQHISASKMDKIRDATASTASVAFHQLTNVCHHNRKTGGHHCH